MISLEKKRFEKVFAATIASAALVLILVSCGSSSLDGENVKVAPETKKVDIEKFSLKDASPEEILKAIESDFEKTTDGLTAELENVKASVGGTYEGYKANKQMLDEWFFLVNAESEDLFKRTEENSKEYYRAVVATVDHEDAAALDDALNDFYRIVYEDASEKYYRAIYEDAMEDVYRTFYDGIIADAYDVIPYDEWSDASTEAYRDWSDASTDAYRVWSDASSDAYRLWSDVSSKFYKKDFDIEPVLK